MPYDGRAPKCATASTSPSGASGCAAPSVALDHGHTAVSQLRPGEIDWDGLFGRDRVRWFHCGGIFAALSPTASEVAEEAMAAARRRGHGQVSYDLNYRASLWEQMEEACQGPGRQPPARPLVDVMLGNEEDFTAALGFEVEGLDPSLSRARPEALRSHDLRGVPQFPEHLGGSDDPQDRPQRQPQRLGGGLCRRGRGLRVDLASRTGDPRVGGGDAFASGLIFGLLRDLGIQAATELGAAHGALAMTTPGDTSMATLDEVVALAKGGSARVRR